MTQTLSRLSLTARFCRIALPALLGTSLCLNAASIHAAGFQVTPEKVSLKGNFARTQLVVSQGTISARSEDLTTMVTYVSSNPKVVHVSETGQLLAVGNGEAVVSIKNGNDTRDVAVSVTDVSAEPKIDFDYQVRPILSKVSCNMGGCHSSQYGQGGFKLSVFGFEPDKDRDAMVRDRQQRRVNFLDPEQSLILKKPTMTIPHGGGRRIEKGSVDYQILKAWIGAGGTPPRKDAAQVMDLKVFPDQRVGSVGMKQQLQVNAVYSDGSVKDVTAWARFDSMDEGLLGVSTDGLVTSIGEGQAPIMIRFEGQAAISTFVIPFSQSMKLADWKNNNFVDELASAKFQELGIAPSALCDDATFIRRAFLDAIGTLPTVKDVVAFVESDVPDKRTLLVDRLLGLTGDPKLDIYNDRYASYWTLKWSDLIRNHSNFVGEQGMWSMHNWIKSSFRENKPFNKFVYELVTAKGSIYMNGPANYFRINKNATDLTESTSQLFLGIRMQCAKCHQHPFEKYSQADYYGLAAFFSRTGTKNSEEFGLFGRESVVVVRSKGDVRHPKTGKVMKPTPLGGEPVEHPLDRRIPLAEWLTSPENKYFAKSTINRYVSYLLGRGLVEPIDDLRQTNPPTNQALMDALSKDFVKSGFNIKHLMRTIMVSRLYQLDSQPTPANESDRRFYSHFRVKRLGAEPLLDAIDQATSVRTKFQNLPLGTSAIELPDAEYPNYFLNTFAKPKRASVCECERSPDESLAQALHTLNGDIIAGKIADKKGRLALLLAAKKPHAEVVKELYLATLSRYPSAAEQVACKKIVDESPSPKEGYEDLLWALINSKQFLFVR